MFEPNVKLNLKSNEKIVYSPGYLISCISVALFILSQAMML